MLNLLEFTMIKLLYLSLIWCFEWPFYEFKYWMKILKQKIQSHKQQYVEFQNNWTEHTHCSFGKPKEKSKFSKITKLKIQNFECQEKIENCAAPEISAMRPCHACTTGRILEPPLSSMSYCSQKQRTNQNLNLAFEFEANCEAPKGPRRLMLKINCDCICYGYLS